MLQQCLPLAVLKQDKYTSVLELMVCVATVLTACGIETEICFVFSFAKSMLQQCLPLAVLKPLI